MAMPTWKDTGPNFGSSNAAMQNAQRGFTQAGASAESIVDKYEKEEQNKIANARAQEQLEMQKQQYADQKEKEAAMQAFAANISKPRQLAESSALFKQVDADPAAFDKRLESVAYTEPENVYTSGNTDQATKDRLVASGLVNPAEVERKTKQQMDLAGMVLAPTDAMKETRTQQIERVMQEMANKGQPITTAIYQELDKARLADETAKAAKEKSLDELIKDSKKERIDMLKYGATALDKSHSGGVTVDDDGTLHYGGAAGTKALISALDAEKKKIIGYQDAIASIPAAINKATEKNKPTDAVRSAMTKSANDLVDTLVANKVDPKVAGELVASQLSAGEKGYLWGTLFGEDGSVKAINPDTMNSLIASGKKLSELEQQKALVTAGGSVPRGSMAYELGVGLSRQADADLASLKANKQVLDMTTEERQYAATKNRLDEILKPAVEMERGSASASSLFDAADGSKIKKSKDLDANIDKAIGHLTDIKEVIGKDGNKIPVKLGEAQIWGIIGNVVPESGFDSGVVGDKNLGGGKEARGIMQWRLDRADALRNFAGEKDISKIPMETQLKFAVQEMAQRAPVDKRNFSSQLEEYMSIKDPKEAAEYISAHYEVAKGNSTRENEARLRGDLTDRLYRDNQKSVADSWSKSDKDASVIASYKQDLTDALKDKDFDSALAIGNRLKEAGVPDAELQKLAGSGSSVDIKKLFEDAIAAPAAPVMPAVASKTTPTPGYQVIMDAAGSLGTTAMSMLKDSPIGYLMNGKSAVKPAVAVLNNTAAGMLQIAGSPYTATKLFTDWLTTGETSYSVFDNNAKQAYATAVQALNEYGIKNPTEQQVIMLVSDMMAPGGASKVVKGMAPKTVELTEEAINRITKSLKQDADAYSALQKARAGQYEVPIGPSAPPPAPKARNVILSSPEELAAAETRRRSLFP